MCRKKRVSLILKLCEKWISIGMQYFKDWPVQPNCGHFFGGVYWYGLETAGPATMMAIVSTSPEYDEAATGYTRKQLRIAALLPDMVDDETGQMLANINMDYMERFGSMPPPSGVYHNTQMEENGWTALGLSSAYLLLPRHPQAEAWAKHAAR